MAEKAKSTIRFPSDGFSLALLTPAERRLAVDVARGYTLEDIAARKVLSQLTVKNRLSVIYGKLGLGGSNARTVLATRMWREAQADPLLASELRCDLFDREG